MLARAELVIIKRSITSDSKTSLDVSRGVEYSFSDVGGAPRWLWDMLEKMLTQNRVVSELNVGTKGARKISRRSSYVSLYGIVFDASATIPGPSKMKPRLVFCSEGRFANNTHIGQCQLVKESIKPMTAQAFSLLVRKKCTSRTKRLPAYACIVKFDAADKDLTILIINGALDGVRWGDRSGEMFDKPVFVAEEELRTQK